MSNLQNPSNVLYQDTNGQPIAVSAASPLPVTGGGSGGGAVTIADGADAAQGAIADAAYSGSGSGTVVAILKYVGAKIEAVRALLAAPLAVTGAFFQATQPVSGTVTVIGPTADGSAASTNPVLISGTTDGTATGLVAVPKVTAGGVLSVDGSASTQPISGSVAVTSLIPGVTATSLGKAEDAAHASGDTGVFSLGVANEAQTVLAQDGDYIGMGHDTKGNTFVIGNVASGVADAGAPVKVGGKYNSAVQTFTNGQRADLQVDQRGGLLIQDGQAIPSVSVTSAATLFTVADTSGYSSISIQVTSAGSACTITYEADEDGATWTSVVGYSPASSAASAPSSTSTAVGTLWFPLVSKQFRARVSTYGSGTVTVQATLRKDALPKQAIQVGFLNGSNGIAGSSADGSAAASSLAIGFEGRTTNKTAVTTGQMVRPIATTIGAAVNKPFQVPELDWSYPAAAGGISNTTTAVTMVAAAGSGIRNYITSVQLSAGALGAATEVAIRDGAGGTVIWRGFLSTSGGAVNATLSSPIKSTANTLLEAVTLTATITGAVYVNAQGYQAP